MLVFPAPPVFPTANWVDNFSPGTVSVISQTLANKSVSRLRVSDMPVGAEFTAFWNTADYLDVQTMLAFFKSADLDIAFTLPSGFWHPSTPVAKKNIIIASSPTGYWRFKEIPKFEDYNLDSQSITITFLGGID